METKSPRTLFIIVGIIYYPFGAIRAMVDALREFSYDWWVVVTKVRDN